LSMATVPPSPPPFPSTTLFRPLWSHRPAHGACARRARLGVPEGGSDLRGASVRSVPPHRRREGAAGEQGGRLHRAALPLGVDHRSEEHTSELQSRENLVCRLLL